VRGRLALYNHDRRERRGRDSLSFLSSKKEGVIPVTEGEGLRGKKERSSSATQREEDRAFCQHPSEERGPADSLVR